MQNTMTMGRILLIAGVLLLLVSLLADVVGLGLSPGWSDLDKQGMLIWTFRRDSLLLPGLAISGFLRYPGQVGTYSCRRHATARSSRS